MIGCNASGNRRELLDSAEWNDPGVVGRDWKSGDHKVLNAVEFKLRSK
jgi:hypothetical protein